MRRLTNYLMTMLVLGFISNMANFAGPGPLPDPPTGHIIAVK